MALSKITYEDKETLNPLPSVADKNKVTDSDMNEIKSVVNSAIDQVEANTIPQQATEPADPSENELWIDITNNQLKRYNGASWENVGAVGITVDSVVSTTSTNPIQNQAITNYVNTMNEYSTSEVNTGKKWTDGKDIYRKCFLKTTSTNIGLGNTVISSGFAVGLNTILSMVGTVDLGGTYYACISKDWNTLIESSGDLIMTCFGTTRTFNKIVIAVEYTKN